MKLSAAIIGLAACAMADLRLATPFGPPPPLPSESDHSSPKLPTSASSHASVVSAHPMAVVPDRGPICKCGYTYCASVLMAMKVPWTDKELAHEYCSTPKAPCRHGTPDTNATSALYICLCDSPTQKIGNKLDLLCGCDSCMVVGPDYRARCESPCSAMPCSS